MATTNSMNLVITQGDRRYSINVNGLAGTVNFRELTNSRTGVKVDAVSGKKLEALYTKLARLVNDTEIPAGATPAAAPKAAKGKAKAAAKPAAKKPAKAAAKKPAAKKASKAKAKA